MLPYQKVIKGYNAQVCTAIPWTFNIKGTKQIFYGNKGYRYINNCAKAQVPKIPCYPLIFC